MADTIGDKACDPEWVHLLKRCISERIIVSEFRDFSKIMMRRHPISGKELIRIVLDARSASNIMWDPLVPLYVEALHKLDFVTIPEILKRLLKYSTLYEDSHPVPKTESDGKGPKRKKKASTLMTDNKIIQNVLTAITMGHGPKSTWSVIETLKAIADWISTLFAWSPSADGPQKGQSGGILGHQDAACIFGTLGLLLVGLAATEKGVSGFSSLNQKGMTILH